jgi:hypothetical protein
VIDIVVPLRMVLSMEGIECRLDDALRFPLL